MPYFENDLALVHARGFGKHADRCAPGLLDLLAPVRGGLVLELGCGAGALTAHLLAAGHRVIATDASPAMVELARTALARTALARTALARTGARDRRLRPRLRRDPGRGGQRGPGRSRLGRPDQVLDPGA